MWGGGVRAGVQVSRRESCTHIHLDLVRVEILSCKQKKKPFIGNLKNKYEKMGRLERCINSSDVNLNARGVGFIES